MKIYPLLLKKERKRLFSKLDEEKNLTKILVVHLKKLKNLKLL